MGDGVPTLSLLTYLSAISPHDETMQELAKSAGLVMETNPGDISEQNLLLTCDIKQCQRAVAGGSN